MLPAPPVVRRLRAREPPAAPAAGAQSPAAGQQPQEDGHRVLTDKKYRKFLAFRKKQKEARKAAGAARTAARVGTPSPARDPPPAPGAFCGGRRSLTSPVRRRPASARLRRFAATIRRDQRRKQPAGAPLVRPGAGRPPLRKPRRALPRRPARARRAAAAARRAARVARAARTARGSSSGGLRLVSTWAD